MKVRQSDLKTWQRCPLQYRFQNIDKLPRLQSASLTFGSIMHDCLMWMEIHQDVEGAVARFTGFWMNVDSFTAYANDGQNYRIDEYMKGTNWKKYAEEGPEFLRKWWNIIQWETDLVLAREQPFDVPIGNGHTLHGTIDKLTIRYRGKTDEYVVLISDYKTNRKVPTYGYLEEDLQFSAYAYATKQREFWEQMFPGNPKLAFDTWQKYLDYPRYGEWVAITSSKRMDAGIREERHFNRLTMAVNALADSVAMRIFVPTISGESCRYCEFRKSCGLPEYVED